MLELFKSNLEKVFIRAPKPAHTITGILGCTDETMRAKHTHKTTTHKTHQPKEQKNMQHITVFLASTLIFSSFATPFMAQNKALEETYAQIERVKAGNEELRTLIADQKLLNNLAREDPIAAQSALKPYAACETSVLKPYCPWFKVIYSPQTADNN